RDPRPQGSGGAAVRGDSRADRAAGDGAEDSRGARAGAVEAGAGEAGATGGAVSGRQDDDDSERDGAFVDAVMRRVATRPLPRRSLWRRIWTTREVTLRIRPASWALSAVALAVVA